MKRFDHPAQPVDPYPPSHVRVTGFRYDSALVLLRLKDAVKMRPGGQEDADYLTGRPYLCAWKDADGTWWRIEVPEGLVTDLTSVPRLLRFLIGRVGPWLEAAIVHDYLYIAWQDVKGRKPLNRDRKFADDIMLAAMKEAGVHRWIAGAIHWAVRTFGGRTFAERDPQRYVDLSAPEIQEQLAFSLPRIDAA